MLAAGLGNVGLDAGLEGCGFRAVRTDDEGGVISCDCAYDLVPLFLVHGGSDGLRAAQGGEDDEEVLGLTDLEAEGFKDLMDGGTVGILGLSVAAGEGVAGVIFLQAEFADVARERRLGDVDALGGEFAAQIILVGDDSSMAGGCVLFEQVLDRVVALIFHAVSLSSG